MLRPRVQKGARPEMLDAQSKSAADLGESDLVGAAPQEQDS